MKEHLDRVIKEQLGAYELPYEAGAWEAFSQRLSPEVTNTTTTSTQFYRKWWFAASVVTAIVATATWLGLSTGTDATSTTAVAVNGNEATTTGNDGSNGTANGTAIGHQSAGNSNGSDQRPSTAGSSHADAPASTATAGTTVNSDNQIPAGLATVLDQIKKNPTPTDNSSAGSQGNPTQGSSSASVSALEISSVNICTNESVSINNPNSIDGFAYMPNGAKKRLYAGKPTTLKSSEKGTIEVVCGNKSQSIIVHAPSSRVYLDANESEIYADGIPALEVRVAGLDEALTRDNISCNKPFEISGNKVIVHAYKGREVELTVETKDGNGCAVTESKRVKLFEEYQLFAQTGLNPYGGDEEKREFMPRALEDRNTPFTLRITNRLTGKEYFRTSDPDNAWDGSFDGQFLPDGTELIWEVSLGDPKSGEPGSYKGILRIDYKH